MQLDKFQKAMEKNSSITEQELLNLLHNFPDSNSNKKVENEFYLIRCNRDEMREDEFIELLLSRTVRYILKREEYLPKGISKEKLIDITWKIIEKARKRFLEDVKSGEIGEITLFVILESKKIIQILNKMNLKTSGKMHVNGLDAIHLQIDNGNITLHYGEAKTYGDFNSALKKAISDLSEFHKDIDKKKSDLNLVSAYIDETKFGKYTDEIKKLIDPYTRNKENFGTCNTVFIGYDWNELQDLSKHGDTNLTEYLVKKFQDTHKELTNKINQEIQKSKISDKNFKFFLMPFRDIGEFRKKFLKEVGKDVEHNS